MKYQVNENSIITGILYNQDPSIILDKNINFGLDKYIGGQVLNASDADICMYKKAFEIRAENQKKLYANEIWFTWYDKQISQAQRALRTGTEWHSNDGIKTYNSLAELDAEANYKQSQIRALKAQLQ